MEKLIITSENSGCDANGDANYSALDAQRIERVASGQDSGFAAYRNVDPPLVADVNRSGTVTLADATIVNQEVQYILTGNLAIDRAEISPLPAGIGQLRFSGPQPLAAMLAGFQAHVESLVVPVGSVPQAKTDAQQAPNAIIDLSGKLAAFSLDAANEADGPRLNGQSWKKQLAGSLTQADTIINPNSKLRIPVSLGASKSVAKV